LSLALSPAGQWYSVTLNPTLEFNSGEAFYIEIFSDNFIPYPAGADKDATIKNKSYYHNGTEWVGLNTISGFENGAFLIRAIGTSSTGGGNQNPNAVATVSKTQVMVNESISFDASQSTDNDGQITQYLWNFGDGTNSSQKSATHSYSQANTYNYSLTVTDNQGATGQATGQIIVSSSSTNLVTVSPASGSIQPGGSNTITLTLNAQTISEGTYSGQVSITTNGGNITIPIDYLVDVEKISSLPNEYSLSQNYPNPFNPSTVIEFSLPKPSEVSLKIYDLLGKEVANLLEEQKSAGQYRVSFDGASLSSGIYFYKLEADNFRASKKMLLIK
jgi:PKD repeat protein